MKIAATFVLVLGMTACGGGTGAEFDDEPVDAAGANAGGAASTGGVGAGGEVTGGATATGGSTTGGAETGGTTTGGLAATGGAATGGVETGGSATGGLAATGGHSQSGGAATGGAATGGVGGSSTGGQIATTGGKGNAGGAASTGGAAGSTGGSESCICTTGVCCDGCRLRPRGYDLGEQLFSSSCDSVVAPPPYDVLRQEYRKMTCTGESPTDVVALNTTGRWVTTMCAYQHCVASRTSPAFCKP